jgi:hypothetical protein
LLEAAASLPAGRMYLQVGKDSSELALLALFQVRSFQPLKKIRFNKHTPFSTSPHMGEYPALDNVFSALTHSTRRKMLDLLAVQDLCVTELAERFPGALVASQTH